MPQAIGQQPGAFPTGTLRLSDIREGALWQFPEKAQQAAFHSIYAGDMAPLFKDTPTDVNGLALIENKNDIIDINFFRVTTEFTVNALFSEPPVGIPLALVPYLSSATRWASITGVGVLVSEPGLVYSVPSTCWYPLHAEGAPTNAGSVLAFFYHTGEGDTLTRMRFPNTVDIYVHMPDEGINEKRTYAFNQQSLGVLRDTSPISVSAITTFGQGFSDYVDLVSIVRELMIRLTLRAKLLNRHSSPHLMGPVGIDGEPPTYDPKGMFLPIVDPEIAPYAYLTWDSGEVADQGHVDNLMNALHIASGVPASAFGLVRGGSQSGISRERQMAASIHRINRYRRMTEMALAEAMTAASMPVTNLEWASDPFASWEERVSTELELIGGGLSDVEQSKRRLFGQTGG